MSEEIEVADFWITTPRYVQQAGQYYPEYVHADPEHPAVIRLPVKYKRKIKDKDSGLVTEVWVETGKNDPHIGRMKPKKPIPPHVPFVEDKQRAADVMGKKKEGSVDPAAIAKDARPPGSPPIDEEARDKPKATPKSKVRAADK
jgi:hypothetical protein